jgi:metal-responsive CopG/Arc/MetJ family transcriptional regulator
METIQVVLDTKLLQATDRAARRTKRNRSALIRDALREHLLRLEIRAREERDREGYARQPHVHDESLVWEAEAAWPVETSVFTSLHRGPDYVHDSRSALRGSAE